jgi:uncharacterized surface protein with fasciclin (FAS1) repeats
MKFYSFACCSALLLSGGAAAATAAEKTAADTKLRNLQAATRPPKASPTPPPTPGATRPPKPVPTDAPVTPSPTPASAQTIAETVCSMDDFFTLCSLIEMSPVISDMLNGDGTYTLFAANNAAFDVILNMVDLSDNEIMGLLLYHIAPNLLTYDELLKIAPGKIETSVPGASIDVTANGDEVLLNGKVKITTKDIVASNGIIQVVDQVIIPDISAPTDSPTKGSTDSPTEAPVTPAPTLKPTEVITPEPTLKPTKAPVSLPDSAKPTPDASSKPPTSDTSKSPSSMWSGGHSTQAPTTRVSFIKPIGTSAPTGGKWGVSPGAFSKAGKSKSKTAKTGGKSSKNSAKSGKSSKAEEVQGKTGKGDGKPGYHAMDSVKQRLGDVDGSLNARFRADFNDASLARGSSFVATVTMLAVAWYWQ